MLSYCLKCGEDTKSISPFISKTVNGGTIILSECTVCNSKNHDLLKKVIN